MATQKVIDDANRLRYIRALERFHKSIVGFLSAVMDLTHEAYNKKIDANLKILQRVQEVQLYKGDLQDLEILVKKMVSYKDSAKDILDIKSDILYSSNKLEKTKNARKYKKDKYSQSKYDDWE